MEHRMLALEMLYISGKEGRGKRRSGYVKLKSLIRAHDRGSWRMLIVVKH